MWACVVKENFSMLFYDDDDSVFLSVSVSVMKTAVSRCWSEGCVPVDGDDPHSLLILAEEELVAVDLQTAGWPLYRLPYINSIHASSIVSASHVNNIPLSLWERIKAAGSSQHADVSPRVCCLWSLRSLGNSCWWVMCCDYHRNWWNVFRSTRPSWPNKGGLSVHPYVSPQNVFPDLNKICYVGRERPVYDTWRYDVWPNPRLKSRLSLKCVKMAYFKGYLLRDYSCNQKTNGELWMILTPRQLLLAIVQARCLSLFSHIARMPDGTDAKKIITPSSLKNWRIPPGRPRTTWMKTIQQDLKSNNLSLDEAVSVAQNRPLWRLMSAFGATHP